MAWRLNELGFEGKKVELCYTDGKSWQNSDKWYSLIFSGGTGIKKEDGVRQTVTLRCLFTGTLDD